MKTKKIKTNEKTALGWAEAALSEVDQINLEVLRDIYRKLKTPAQKEEFMYLCPAVLSPFFTS